MLTQAVSGGKTRTRRGLNWSVLDMDAGTGTNLACAGALYVDARYAMGQRTL